MKTKAKISPVEKILERMSQCLMDESAKRILKIRTDAAEQKYLDGLAEKNREGTITPEEQAEYEDCLALGNFLAILKSKIRRNLTRKDEG